MFRHAIHVLSVLVTLLCVTACEKSTPPAQSGTPTGKPASDSTSTDPPKEDYAEDLSKYRKAAEAGDVDAKAELKRLEKK